MNRGHTDVVSATPLIVMLTALRLAVRLRHDRIGGAASGSAKGPGASRRPGRDLGRRPRRRHDNRRTADRVGAYWSTARRCGSPQRARTARLAARRGTQRRRPAALAAAYDDFRPVNADFKSLVTDWQLKGGPGGTPNTHDDAEYDAAVLARLADVHARVLPIIEAAAPQLPRLNTYSAKLVAALGKVQDGDTAWLTRPLIDSYHTVWFELARGADRRHWPDPRGSGQIR